MNFSKKNHCFSAPVFPADSFGVKHHKSNKSFESKNLITTITLFIVFVMSVNAQIIIDDFTTGTLPYTTVKEAGEKKLNQTGSMILNNKRSVILKIKKNTDKQLFQTLIKKGRLVTSIGYGITGVVELRYGYDNSKKLNLDLTKHKYIHIEYEAKSNFGRVYVSIFSNGPNRAFWRGGGNTTEVYQGSINPGGSNKRNFEIKIPLDEFISAQDNANVENKFTMSDVDYFKIQFITQGLQGINFAVKKIWIE